MSMFLVMSRFLKRYRRITTAAAGLLFIIYVSLSWYSLPTEVEEVAMTSRFKVNGTNYILPATGAAFSLSDILDLCHNGFEGKTDISVTATYAVFKSYIDEPRHDYLAKCFPIEISTSQGGRSMGHCSDFAQYVFYGGGRLSTDQRYRNTFEEKAKLCPTSMYLHGEYLLHHLLNEKVNNLWMPNIEQVTKDSLARISNMTTILCKTKITCTAFRSYLKAHNLEKPDTIFMSHSSPDTAINAVEALGPDVAHNIYQNFNKFIHVYGGSGRKSTREVLECWTRHPLWPQLTVIGNHPYEKWKEDLPNLARKWNINIKSRVSIKDLRKLQLSNGVHICPSSQEGYGHYINEARALGALVVTTDHPPMNEFVEDGVSGILIGHSAPVPEEYQGLSDHFISPASVTVENVCEGIERVLKMTMAERKAMGQNARMRYDEDNKRMEKNIKLLVKGWPEIS